MIWKYFIVDVNSKFFDIFKKVIKQIPMNKNEITIKCKMGIFKFLFFWQSDTICGIDVYKGKKINLHLNDVTIKGVNNE